ncbi:MAG: fumarylacetoacetate hydrolase, partial [Desulfobacterales bacterium]|nr:fumarylacetoacetate hydrolase [Desulfobacterales bacterium]
MQLIRFGQDGNEKPGLWKDNRIVDLKKIYPEIPDFDEEFFEKGWLEKIKLITDAGERMDVRIGCPVCR